MDTRLNLESVEKDVFKSYWDDGLIDLLLGVGLALIGIVWLGGLVGLVTLIPILLLPVWYVVRTRVTGPRLGFVRFSARRRERTRIGLNTAVIVGFGLLTLFGAFFVLLKNDSSGIREWIAILVPGLPSLVLAVGLFAAWLGFSMPRFQSYAMVLGVAGLIGVVTTLDPGWQFVGSGLIVGIAGGVILSRFLAHNPIARAENEGTH